MKNDIKIIFTDIDCTIFDHSRPPSRFDFRSIRELKRVQKKGIKVFLCTARPYHSLEQIKLLDYITPDGLILANGGIVIIDDKIIYQTTIKPKEFEWFCELALKYNANVEGIRPYNCFLIKEEDEAVHALFATYPERIPPVEDYHGQEVIGMTLFMHKDLDEEVVPQLPKDYYYFRYHDYGVDVSNEIHEKGKGVRVALNYLGISKDNAMAIGDDLQDIDMLKEVKYAIAMGNAKDEVKDASTHITKTVTKHGVKAILRKLI